MLRLICLLLFPVTAQAEVTVFAAASLRSVLEEVAPHAEQDLRVSYAGSAALARQIVLGAPADIYITAHPDWMAWLVDQAVVDEESVSDLIGNALVLAAPAETQELDIQDLPEMLGDAPLAIGNPVSVPAGQYAKEALTYLGLWSALKTQVIAAENVRAALRFVALKEVPFGIAYASDVAADPAVTAVYNFPKESHRQIRYQIAVLNPNAETMAFKSFLLSDAGEALFLEQGFSTLNTK